MSFNTNFQFNIAQLNSISKEQEKNKQVSNKQQEKISNHIEKVELTQQEKVSEAHDKDNSTKVRDDEQHEMEEREEKSQDSNVALHNKETGNNSKKEKIVVYKDKDKGNIVDFSG